MDELAAPGAGKMKHFASPRDKKILALGLISLLSCPADQVPQEIAAGLQQVSNQVNSTLPPAAAAGALRSGGLPLPPKPAGPWLRGL